MKNYQALGIGMISIFFLGTLNNALAQSYEVYDQEFRLKSRIEYDRISILGESVRISSANQELKLLSKEYKPYLSLDATSLIAYNQPWMVVKGENGQGVFHEYGEQIFPVEYDEIQTLYSLVLAKKGNDYWVYNNSDKQTKFLGNWEDAKLTTNGQVIAKSAEGYFLPLSIDPKKQHLDVKQINENFLISKQSTGLGLINREGNYILDPIIDQMEYLEDNYFFALEGNQYMLIRGREEKVDIKYTSYHKITHDGDMILEFVHGKLRRVMKNDGILLDQVGMEKVVPVGQKHFNVFLRDKKLGLLGPNGWEVNPIADVEKILPGTENLFPAMNAGKYGFINKSGNWSVDASYEEVRVFREEIAAVKNKGLWGFIDKSGQLMSPFQFESVSDFENGISIVKQNGKYHLFKKSDFLLSDASFGRISRGADDYFISENESVFGLLDPFGYELIKPRFDELRREGKDRILVRLGDKYGILDEKGDFLLPLFYKSILFDHGSSQILAEYQYQAPPLIVLPENNKEKKKRLGDR
jgi:hypothetical protein